MKCHLFLFCNYFLHRSNSASGQTSGISVTIFSDSIFRDLGHFLEELNPHIFLDVQVMIFLEPR